jgi:hypothetical protein
VRLCFDVRGAGLPFAEGPASSEGQVTLGKVNRVRGHAPGAVFNDEA